MAMIDRAGLGNWPAFAGKIEDADGGTAIEIEFVCGEIHGWIEVQDGMFGQVIQVWRYGKTNEKLLAWKGRDD